LNIGCTCIGDVTKEGVAMVIAGLPVEWKSRAMKLRRWAGASDAARAWEAAAEELEAALTGEEDDLLDLPSASFVSGYSADHLGRLVRQGRIPNAGRRNAPRIRTSDLPRKPGYLPPDSATANPAVNREQIARTLLLLHREQADG